MNKNAFNTDSVMQFKGYKVNKIYFEENLNCLAHEFDVRPYFFKKMNIIDDNNFEITLGCKIQPSEDNPFPFSAEVVITGVFQIDSMNENNKILMSENSVAILFPYLRSTLSMLTMNANINPLILPTINIVELLKQYDKEEL